jgi:hypothetical protein
MTLLTGIRAKRLWRYIRHGYPRGAIWGIANPVPIPTVVSPSGDVTCTAGTEVICAATATALVGQPGQGYFPLIFGAMTFLMGATASASLVIAARFHSGADFAQTQTVDTGLLANNATIVIPVVIVGANATANAAGKLNTGVLEVTALAGTTACTCRAASTFLAIGLSPGS